MERKVLTSDLFMLLDILYKRGPRTVEEITKITDGVTNAELADVIDKLAHVNDWLKLS
jgi:hypothetical protein